MKYILKINDVTETVNCSAGKHTFSIPHPNAIKKAKAALRKGNNLAINIDSENPGFGTSSAKVSNFKKVPAELYPFWNEYVPPVNKEHAEMMSFIHNDSVSLRPSLLMLPDLKWKYLVRSAMRAKNIMMTGAAGSGMPMAAKALANALDRPEFYFNLGATQDPRSTLVGNTHFAKDSGTFFSESSFGKAIQTEDAIILLDELSRAHPEAWNILMTVLDPGQRYLRLDEADNSPIIKVAKGVTFIATANIGNEYTSTRVIDRALLDRFTIIEMELLTKEKEEELLLQMYPEADKEMISNIASIVSATRDEMKTEVPRISTSVSTRASVEFASLCHDGFSLEEAAEVTVYPLFDDAGGLDSERTFIKQLVQKFIPANTDENLFNTEEGEELFTQEDVNAAS